MLRYYPEKIIMLDDRSVKESVVAKNIIDAARGRGIAYSYLSQRAIDEMLAETLKLQDPFNEGKKTLLITKNSGEFLKKCPGTNDYICCDYYIIDFAQNCPMDCSYCILQAYLNNPFMIVYANIDDLFAELDRRILASPGKHFRIGTGEFTDSMALEHLSSYSKLLMDYFKKRPDALIEFKSKTDYVDTFIRNGFQDNVLLSWSMNAQNVMEKEEFKTATIAERLEAASRCTAAGYKITLHFDPIIDYEDFENQMEKTVDMIFCKLKPSQIKYISLGAFRFIPALAETISIRFPRSKIIYNEFVRGYDKKSRYFRFKRERLFKIVAALIKKRDPKNEIELYFCMESPEMWNALLRPAPASDEELGETLYRKCKNCDK